MPPPYYQQDDAYLRLRGISPASLSLQVQLLRVPIHHENGGRQMTSYHDLNQFVDMIVQSYKQGISIKQLRTFLIDEDMSEDEVDLLMEIVLEEVKS
jgi:hypothetical protein